LSEQGVLVPPKAAQAFAGLAPYAQPAPVLAVISGPSGAGKDSVIKRMRELNQPFRFLVTTTDREIRPGEVDGLDYNFVSTAEFERMIAEDELLEHALVYGQYKGVPKAQARQALASGRDVVMRVDVQGVATIRRLVPQALSVFLTPPSVDVLISRLRRRASDSPQQLQKRLDTALLEMQRIDEFQYVVVNQEGRLDDTVRQIVAIIAAEKCRTARPEIVL
jgi:guanylate kinase